MNDMEIKKMKKRWRPTQGNPVLGRTSTGLVLMLSITALSACKDITPEEREQIKAETEQLIEELDINVEDINLPDPVSYQHISLVRSSVEPRGDQCAEGGIRIEKGFDDNDDKILQAEEVDKLEFVCYGVRVEETDPSVPAINSLVQIMDEGAGENCDNGGVRVESGLDDNNDLQLQPEEVDQARFICDGQNGELAANVLVLSSEVSSEDSNCDNGGIKIETGYDLDLDGALVGEEVLQTRYLCHGLDGENGLDRLQVATDENVDRCDHGGFKVDSGLDVNRNTILDEQEIDLTQYVCHGAPGEQGTAQLVLTTPDVFEGPCTENGGLKIEVGSDLNGDGVFSGEEPKETRYLCDGDQGAAGFVQLVFSTEFEGVYDTCTHGGVLLQSGLDRNRDAELQTGEIEQTQAVCHGTDGLDGLQQMVLTTPEAPGAHCAHGGLKIEMGLDDNRNQVLDNTAGASEIDSTKYLCQGVAGVDGIQSLMISETIEAGANSLCAEGGVLVSSGVDDNNDTILQEGEITLEQKICHGDVGDSGLATLMLSTPIPNDHASGQCPDNGGLEIATGVDDNRNQQLETNEIDHRRYVCHGADGEDGATQLVESSSFATSEMCDNGGILIESGLDTDANGILADDEIEQTESVCHGSQGNPGFNSLVNAVEIGAGDDCVAGGLRIESGLDDAPANGTLEANEIDQPQFLCHGVQGPQGEPGFNYLFTSQVEPLGVNCPSGGLKIDSGLDLDRNDVLDTDEANNEVTNTQYLCHYCAIATLDALTVTADGSDVDLLSPSFNAEQYVYVLSEAAIGNSSVSFHFQATNGLPIQIDSSDILSNAYVHALNAGDLGIQVISESCSAQYSVRMPIVAP